MWPRWLQLLGLNEEKVSYRNQGSCLWAASADSVTLLKDAVAKCHNLQSISKVTNPSDFKEKVGSRVWLGNAMACVVNADEATVDSDSVGITCYELATKNGAEIHRSVKACSITLDADGWCTGVETSIGFIAADRVVIASGVACDAMRLAKTAGVNIPLVICTDVLVRTSPSSKKLLKDCSCLQKFTSDGRNEVTAASASQIDSGSARASSGIASIMSYHLRQNSDGHESQEAARSLQLSFEVSARRNLRQKLVCKNSIASHILGFSPLHLKDRQKGRCPSTVAPVAPPFLHLLRFADPPLQISEAENRMIQLL
eukprot:TRINITY_DN119641_c0_g1_i2.p1 TRINITY_DN119641_c0_g1~~TRINITY_DN119641_c0_g1_i2.p1  ORF type:complete len:314 (-),score=14.19 TRINITY_DN119641_c0_g1_i2:4-945(-)